MITPSHLSQENFIQTFGGVYEHAPWVAEQLFHQGIDTSFNHKDTLKNAMREILNNAGKDAGLTLLRAHPELGANLDTFKKLTRDSQNEQSSAGLNALAETQRQDMITRNKTYKDKFQFPFIVAVKGLSLDTIIQLFHTRIHNHPDEEYFIAIHQVHKIAAFRIDSIFSPQETLS